MKNKKGVVILIIAGIIAGGTYVFRDIFNQNNTELVLYGNVDIRSVNLALRVGGRLESIYVDEGDTIKAGQLLAKLDDRPYLNALQQAEANRKSVAANLSLIQAGFRTQEITQATSKVNQTKANYQFVSSSLKRQESLWKSRTISANEIENARSIQRQAQAEYEAAESQLALLKSGNRPQQILIAEANLLQAEAQVAQAELNLEDTQLLSPSEGVILTRLVEPGSLLATGNTVLTLTLNNPVWVRAYIDEVNLGYAIPGRMVTVYSDTNPSKAYSGKIGFVSPTAEFTPKSVETPVLRTDLVYRLRIIIQNADDELRQGMPVTVKFTPQK